MRFATIFGAAALAFAAIPASATTITNVPAWNGTTYIFSFGSPDTTNYGQTFLSPGGNITSLTFFLGQGGGGDFRIAVAGWDGSAVTGSNLWTSDDISYVGAAGYGVNLNLPTVAGGNYIAYLTVAGVANPVTALAVGGTEGNTIASGAFRFLNSNGAAPAPGQGWSDWFIQDMAFIAEFNGASGVIPEPATWAMMIAGFGLVGFVARRRRTTLAHG